MEEGEGGEGPRTSGPPLETPSSVSVRLSSSRLTYLIRRRVPVHEESRGEGEGREGRGGVEYIRGILNNFWRLTEATRWWWRWWWGMGLLSLCLPPREEKTLWPERRTKRKVRAKRERERERERRKDASVVRVAFFARNLLLSRLLFGPDRNSAKCID